MKYSPEIIDEVVSHIRSGALSYNGIADTINAQFGISLTRNSISSIAYRKGLQSKAAPPKVTARRSQQKPRAWFKSAPPVAEKPKPFVAEVVTADDVARISLAEMEARHCRWPVGDPRDKDFGYCGLQRVNPYDVRAPYCAIHRKRARASGASE